MCCVTSCPETGATTSFNSELNSFVQYYGSNEPDASLLMMALVGFLPPNDPRIEGTVDLVQRRLVHDGFVERYFLSPLTMAEGNRSSRLASR